jgi:hypothetical protein
MNAHLFDQPARPAAIRGLARALRSGDWQTVVDVVIQVTEHGPVQSRIEGAKKLLVEAGAQAVLQGFDGMVLSMPSRFFACLDLKALVDDAYRLEGVDDEVRQRAIAYLRRIGITDDFDPVRDERLADMHEVVSFSVTNAFED